MLAFLGAVALGLVAWNSPDPLRLHVAGWVVGTWVAEACLIAYRLRDRKLRGRRDYVTTARGGLLIAVMTFAAVVVGGYHGWEIALWWAS